MNANISAKSENPISLDNIHQAFAQACYCYGAVVNNHTISGISQENKLRWLAFSAIDLATAIQQFNDKSCVKLELVHKRIKICFTIVFLINQ